MRTLYHFPLSPFSRKVRILLKEKHLDFELIIENFWDRRREFLKINPAGEVPVFVDENDQYICDSMAICEYIDEKYPEIIYVGCDSSDIKMPEKKAEVRRLVSWFDNKFYDEVGRYILTEKVLKHYKKEGPPSSRAVIAARKNIIYHLEYIAFLVKKRKWLAGDEFSLADITAAAHLSVIDYLGDVPWERNKHAKEWYALVKSRPSFRPLLHDRIVGFKPPAYYQDLDF